jgi:hypothetical protein
MRTRTVHLANDIHRVLKAMAAHEELPVQAVLDRVLRYALNLPTDKTAGAQLPLESVHGSVPAALRR